MKRTKSFKYLLVLAAFLFFLFIYFKFNIVITPRNHSIDNKLQLAANAASHSAFSSQKKQKSQDDDKILVYKKEDVALLIEKHLKPLIDNNQISRALKTSVSQLTPKEYKVVLTGFGPYEDVLENESWLAVSKLAEMKWPNRIKLVTCELYVDYKVVKEQVKSLWSNEMPDLMIHVGVVREATKISIERCAFNDGYIDADVSGNCPHGNICVENGSNTLNTKLNVERILEATNKIFKQKYPVCDASNDPGRYLCGFTYYFSLHQDNSKSLLVHVPSKECLTLEEMAISLRAIIFDSLDQLYGYKV